MPLLGTAGAILIVINLIKRKVVIYNDSILVVNLFSSKELYFKDIKGCRVGQKVIYIEPVSPGDPKITIGNYIDFGDSSQMAAVIKEKFKDLDEYDTENERNELLQDQSLGFSEADREAQLKKAKLIAIVYSIAGVVIGFGSIAIDTQLTSLLLIIYPLSSILVMYFSKGLIKFITNTKRSVYPFISTGFMAPSICMLIMSMGNYTFLNGAAIWQPAIAVSAIIGAVIYFADRIRIAEPVQGKIIFITLMSALYGFGAIIQINCAFDTTKPQVYKVVVLDHHISHGKSTSYYITIAPWGPETEQKDIDAGRRLYDVAQIGDTVNVKLRPGLLNYAWYYVTAKP